MRVHRRDANQIVKAIGEFSDVIDAVNNNVQMTEEQRRSHGPKYGK